MKKLLALAMTLVLCFGMVACGSKDGGDSKDSEKDVPKIEKTIDAIAAALELPGEKEEKFFQMIGATDGAGFGDVEIYIFDEDSESYEQFIGDGYDMGFAVLKASAYKDGVIIISSNASESVDPAIVEKFNALNFK